MDPLSILGLILGIPNLLLVALSQLAFWQRKEYRLDRALSTLRDQESSYKEILVLSPLVVLLFGDLLKLPILGIVSHLLILSYYLPRTLKLGLYRPKWTSKAILLTFLLVIVISLYLPFMFATPTNLAIRLAALVILVFPLTPILVVITNIMTNPKKMLVIRQAKKLRASLGDLQVIGVTGSYGKTTTKHYLSRLLPEAKVSTEHRNSDYVIATDMLEQLKPDTKKYIVEMSAYKAGEISDLAKLSSPSVGVITHIGNQHLALFGSQENITNAKWELIEALPKNGIAVLNADDDLIIQQAKRYHGSIKWFSLTKPADVYATDIQINPDNLQFNLHISNNKYNLTVKLLSEAYLYSVLAAACAAHAVGAQDADIVDRIKKLKQLPRTMQLLPGVNEATIIDDSYSASEESVENSIRHLNRFPQSDKRIVLVPLIELGKDSKKAHKQIGKLLKESKSKVYIYGTAFRKELGQEVFSSPEKLIKAINSGVTSDTIILLEGRVPDIIRHKLIANHSKKRT